MPLTAVKIEKTKSAVKPQKLFDGYGLYLLINPNGSRYWRFKFRVHGKEKLLALGKFPGVSLKRARELREEAREKLSNGTDPSIEKKTEKRLAALS